MSIPPDWDDLARRYLDLWQQNISAAAADPDTARDLAQLISGFGAFAGMGAAGSPTKATDASSISAALAAIERRLAAIEERLDGVAVANARPAARQPAKARHPASTKARKPAAGKAGAVKAKLAKPRAGRTKKD